MGDLRLSQRSIASWSARCAHRRYGEVLPRWQHAFLAAREVLEPYSLAAETGGSGIHGVEILGMLLDLLRSNFTAFPKIKVLTALDLTWNHGNFFLCGYWLTLQAISRLVRGIKMKLMGYFYSVPFGFCLYGTHFKKRPSFLPHTPNKFLPSQHGQWTQVAVNKILFTKFVLGKCLVQCLDFL